ncbi:hypothetical protein OAV21_01595 [bacterium]|jgi:hypothetical protein|nr:hypothetical protein [Verrucomicrobiales bacterium]MDC3255075.1 hypothetical protein [bacterium]
MTEKRRYHEANAGRDSKPVIWIFEGNNVLWMILGFGLALLVFRLCYGRFHLSFAESDAISLVPLSITLAYVILLKSGKPKSFDGEFFEWGLVKLREFFDRQGWLKNRPYFGPQHRVKTEHPFATLTEDSDDCETH